jgi:hypothetical protein
MGFYGNLVRLTLRVALRHYEVWGRWTSKLLTHLPRSGFALCQPLATKSSPAYLNNHPRDSFILYHTIQQGWEHQAPLDYYPGTEIDPRRRQSSATAPSALKIVGSGNQRVSFFEHGPWEPLEGKNFFFRSFSCPRTLLFRDRKEPVGPLLLCVFISIGFCHHQVKST